MWRTSALLLLWIATASCPAAVPAAVACPTTPVERYEPRSFLGYACADDCQRHKAGFAWAARRRLTEASACTVLRAAAEEGCRAYVEEPLGAEAAGFRWALENEVNATCLCDGAGAQFRAGCRAALACPPGGPARCAEAWPGYDQPFQRHGSGR